MSAGHHFARKNLRCEMGVGVSPKSPALRCTEPISCFYFIRDSKRIPHCIHGGYAVIALSSYPIYKTQGIREGEVTVEFKTINYSQDQHIGIIIQREVKSMNQNL